MKATHLFLSAIAVLAFASCKKDLEPQESAVADTVATVTPVDATATATTQPIEVSTANATPNPTVTTTAATTQPVVARGMNPAHGQPGHRCDIAVGAPLNSPAGKTVTPKAQNPAAATITPVPISATPSQSASAGTPAILNAPTNTAPGMNPPHGQAGHKCDVAVGAPLPKS